MEILAGVTGMARAHGTADIVRRMTALTALALCVSGRAGAQKVDEVLAAAERAYRQTTTLQAGFVQLVDNPMLGAPEEARGSLYLSPPDRFSMRFEDPAGDRIVADGTWLWLFTPSSVPDQVIRQPIPEAGPATPNLFAQFVDRPLDRYRATYVGADTVRGVPVENVRLVPSVDGIPFREAVISVGPEGTLRKLDLVEETGQRRTLVFERIERNKPIPATELVFRPPPGVRVITP